MRIVGQRSRGSTGGKFGIVIFSLSFMAALVILAFRSKGILSLVENHNAYSQSIKSSQTSSISLHAPVARPDRGSSQYPASATHLRLLGIPSTLPSPSLLPYTQQLINSDAFQPITNPSEL